MKHRNKLLFLFIFLLGISSCQEDTVTPDVFGSLSGEVLLAADGSPIVDATVSTTPASSTVQTDASGKFIFENIKDGSYTVRAEKDGLISAVETITIFEEQTATVIIRMSVPDETNLPPSIPNSPTPANGATGQPIELELGWMATDPDEDDVLLYSFRVYKGSPDPDSIVVANTEENTLTVSDLRYSTTYFWQVSVSDGVADPVFSETWQFTTEDFPNHPFVFAKVFNSVYEIYGAIPNNEPYQLTTGGSNFRPRISPFGNRIAFINGNFPIKQLMVMDRDGGNLTTVDVPVPIDGENPFELDYCWSPDGTALLYMNEERLFKVNIDGTGQQLLVELNTGEEFIEVDWNGPTGRIAARTVGSLPFQSRILLYEEDGSFLQEVVPDDPGSIGGPSFSIDGSHLLFTRDTSGFEDPGGRQLESHVFLKNLATGVEQDLSVNKPLGFNDLDARFSPNGAFIIFVHTNSFPNSQKDIYLMNLQGIARTVLFENSEMPDWWQ